MAIRRIDGLLTERIENELLILDPATNEGHALNEAAAAVFNLCDGETSRSTMMSVLARDFGLPAEPVVGRLEAALATPARDHIVVHAAVVGWRGAAILIPAAAGAGTSTLVDELLRRGAQRYSDEWAVFDDAGHVVATERELSPVRVVLVVATTYRPRCAWEPKIVRGARALLRVIEKAIMVRSEPARVLRLAAALGPGVVLLESPRPEAHTVAATLLDFADSLHIGHMAHSPPPRKRSSPSSLRRLDHGAGTPPPEILATERSSTHPVTTFTVGGIPRSGSSMMMRALAAGGLEMFVDPAKDAR